MTPRYRPNGDGVAASWITAFLLLLVTIWTNWLQPIYYELRSKDEFSHVLDCEYRYRSKHFSGGYKIENINEHAVLGVKSMDGTQIVWILLNPRYPPFLKKKSDCKSEYELMPVDLKAIQLQVPNIQKDVLKELSDHTNF